MGTLARDNLKILQQLRGRILEETGVVRNHWLPDMSTVQAKIVPWKDYAPCWRQYPASPTRSSFLEETRQCSESGSPAAVLCVVEDVTPQEEQS